MQPFTPGKQAEEFLKERTAMIGECRATLKLLADLELQLIPIINSVERRTERKEMLSKFASSRGQSMVDGKVLSNAAATPIANPYADLAREANDLQPKIAPCIARLEVLVQSLPDKVTGSDFTEEREALRTAESIINATTSIAERADAIKQSATDRRGPWRPKLGGTEELS